MTDHRPEVRELLKESRRGHYYCEDSWYSCPLAEGGCADARQPKAKCNCGASEWNARVEAALAAPPIEPVGVTLEKKQADDTVRRWEFGGRTTFSSDEIWPVIQAYEAEFKRISRKSIEPVGVRKKHDDEKV